MQALLSRGVTVLTVVRDLNETVAGFMTLDLGCGHIDQLAVLPDDWGQGVGSFLLDHAKRLCPSGLSLEVNQDNHRAVRLYEREGFSRIAAGTNPNSGLKTWSLAWHVSADG